MDTVKLYRENAYTTDFGARVENQTKSEEGFEIVLDRTAFYPAGGGQPFDTGWLNGIPVTDVMETGGTIVHILQGQLESHTVTGKIDWKRRFDHMQQHAGQHILSSCFERIAGADTVGFHLGSQYVSIDLNRQDLTSDHMAQAEELANKIVFNNLAIKTYIVEPEELAGLPLRKVPTVDKNIRIVEIDGFDYSPCGGTHPSYTGGIGLIKIRRWEKSGDNTRIEFVCGGRALRDYSLKNASINSISSLLSVRDFEAADMVEKILSDNKSLLKTIGELKEGLCKYEAQDLVQKTPTADGIRVIKHLFDNRPFEEIRSLASAIISENNCIALLCTVGQKNRVLAGRSENIDIDMRKPFDAAMSQLGGRGGGSSRVVQGGFDSAHKAQLALDMLHETILKLNKTL
jgi:alanyl-tRNA synthetase